jgi:DoxX-like family
MQIAVIVVSIGLAIFVAVAGFLNVFFVGDARKNQAHLRISVGLTRFIGWCQWASVVGLIGGLWWRPIGIAAAIGLLLLLIGAGAPTRRRPDQGDGESDRVLRGVRVRSRRPHRAAYELIVSRHPARTQPVAQCVSSIR